jgi:N-acetyl sugar amidotransferase
MTKELHYQRCTRCVMDTTASDIIFDIAGHCNFCSDYLAKFGRSSVENSNSGETLRLFVEKVKKQGKGKPYDCVVGISGGVDSSWTLVKAVELGLRPLAVHMDNGWNSELAQNNIANLVTSLGLDLYTYVIEWEEYRALMRAFLDADVVDVELLYDNAMLRVNHEQAKKYSLKYILSGSNHTSEGLLMPKGWNWLKYDARNIRGIARTQKVKIKSFPAIGTGSYLRYRFIHNVNWLPFLDMTDYNKESALSILERDYGYKRYPYKHYESIFTRFYQAVILPEKFGIDKRKLHLSSLISSGQLERDDALQILASPTYSTTAERQSDTEYFLKKIGWNMDDLQEYLARPTVEHDEFSSELSLWNFAIRVNNFLKTKLMHRKLRS